jgi:hypothetical protein
MRDRPEHDDGRDGHLPHAKRRGFRIARQGAPGRRNRVLRAGKSVAVQTITTIIEKAVHNLPPLFAFRFSPAHFFHFHSIPFFIYL